MLYIFKSIEGHNFTGWGAHTDQPFQAYLTAAAAIGTTNKNYHILNFKMKLNVFTIYEEKTWGILSSQNI